MPSGTDPRDDLDLAALGRAIGAATPRPDPAVRAAHLRLAEESFARLQAAGAGPRPTPRRGRVWTDVREALTSLTSRGGLSATTALVAVGVLAFTPAGQDLWRRGASGIERDVPVAVEAPAEARTDDADAVTPDARGPAPTESPALAEAAEPAEPAGDDAVAAATAAAEAPGAEPAAAQARSRGVVEGEAPLAGAAGDAVVMPAPAPPPSQGRTDLAPSPLPDAEAFVDGDPVRIVAEAPVSTFPIDVGTASYAVVRGSLAAGEMPPPEAVRVEEMVNAFPYDHPTPQAGEGPVRPTLTVMPTPWNAGTRLVHIAIQGARPALADRSPLDPAVPIAEDLEAQVEWNPAAVAEYRLIGDGTRALRREGLDDDRADAGDLGAGHAVTAIYEVTPVGSPARPPGAPRHAAEAVAPPAPPGTDGGLGLLRLRWTVPRGEEGRLLETPIREGPPEGSAGTAGSEARFAAAVAGWGLLLRGDDRLGAWGYDEAAALAAANRGEDPLGTRAEAVRLMRLSGSLAE